MNKNFFLFNQDLKKDMSQFPKMPLKKYLCE